MDELQGRLHFGEFSIGGGGYAVARHEILGEGLRAFQLRRRRGGPEAGQPGRLEAIDDA